MGEGGLAQHGTIKHTDDIIPRDMWGGGAGADQGATTQSIGHFCVLQVVVAVFATVHSWTAL